MIEVVGDLFELGASGSYDALVIPVNTILDRHGDLVMGAGVAKAAKIRWPRLPSVLGKLNGTPVAYVTDAQFGVGVIAMRTKIHWRDDSTLELIDDSARRLAAMTARHPWKKVIMPQVGCGKGGLVWVDVSKILASVLDDRFHVTRGKP